jgi:hypothetical protein
MAESTDGRDGDGDNGESRESGNSGEASEEPKLGRRKLLYVAPAIASQSMFYALAGCGKAQPQQLNCFRVPRSGS